MKRKIYYQLATTGVGTATVVVLFLLSENIIHHHNSFLRRFPTHSAQKIAEIDLEFNSYYFAGIDPQYIYLGNTTAPFLVVSLNLQDKALQTHKIELLEKDLPFSSPRIKVSPPHFYVYEGSVPYIYKGSTADWKGSLVVHTGYHFSQLVPAGENTLLLRYQQPATGESTIGMLKLPDTANPLYNHSLLQKQIDGIFDTDGQLLFDAVSQRLVYTYYYRNQYIIADRNLALDHRGNTIDTVSKAQLRLATVKSHNIRTLAAPPLTVNRLTAADNGQLFVNAALPGNYESDMLWKSASIIDIYKFSDQSYRNSFPVYHEGNDRLRGFIVRGQRLYALIGTKLITYSLLDDLANPLPEKHQTIDTTTARVVPGEGRKPVQ